MAFDRTAPRPAPSPAPQTTTETLILRAVTRDAAGRPALAGIEADACLFLDTPPAPGAIAVAKPMGDGSGRYAVLGCLAPGEAAATPTAEPAAPGLAPDLVFRNGRSELRLCADGRIRLKGDDLSADMLGRLALRGAFIDLN